MSAMSDLRNRFRSLDRQPAPDLWAEATARPPAAPQPSRLPALGPALAVVAVVILAVVAGIQIGRGPLIGGPGPSDAASAEPSVQPSESGPVPSVQPSNPAEPPFVCDLPITMTAAGTDFHPLVTQDIGVEAHDGYDRIVFTYDGGTPSLELDLAQPPYVQDPSGLPMTVNGSPVYRVTLTGATKFDTETGDQPYTGPTDFQPGFEQIVQFTEFGDFEAVHNWYLGVNGGTCLRAFTLADPRRLVIDVQHPPAPSAQTADGDFRLTISAPRTVWRTDEVIELGATLEYFGTPRETTLRGSGSGPVVFSLVELTGERRMGAAYTSDCATHVIGVDDPIVTPYQKSGGYSADEPDAAFWEAFFADPELHLPPGQWRVTAEALFDDGPDCTANPVQLSASIVLTITE